MALDMQNSPQSKSANIKVEQPTCMGLQVLHSKFGEHNSLRKHWNWTAALRADFVKLISK